MWKKIKKILELIEYMDNPSTKHFMDYISHNDKSKKRDVNAKFEDQDVVVIGGKILTKIWFTIKMIFKILFGIEFNNDEKYLDRLTGKNTDPIFKSKDENKSRFSAKTFEEEKQNHLNKKRKN